MTKTLYTVVAALVLVAMHSSAHHAFSAEYDQNKLVTVSGTVTKFQWTNPHVWLSIDEKDATGNITSWRFEMGSPNGLLHRGWTSTELKEGDQVAVDGYGAKDGGNVANARIVTLPDGRKLFGGFGSTPGNPFK